MPNSKVQALLLFAVIIHISSLWPPMHHCDPKFIISFGNSDIFSRHPKVYSLVSKEWTKYVTYIADQIVFQFPIGIINILITV